MTEEEYWEDEYNFETMFLRCSNYCEELLAKRLGLTDDSLIEGKLCGEALKILKENWKQIEDEICDLYGEEEIEDFPVYMHNIEEDFRPIVKDGMENCYYDLQSKWRQYRRNEETNQHCDRTEP